MKKWIALGAVALIAVFALVLDRSGNPSGFSAHTIGHCKLFCQTALIASNKQGDVVAIWDAIDRVDQADRDTTPIYASFKHRNGKWGHPELVSHGVFLDSELSVDGVGNVYFAPSKLVEPIGVHYPIFVRDANSGHWSKTFVAPRGKGGIGIGWRNISYTILANPQTAGATTIWNDSKNNYGLNPWRLAVSAWDNVSKEWKRVAAPFSDNTTWNPRPAINDRGDIAVSWYESPSRKGDKDRIGSVRRVHVSTRIYGSSKWVDTVVSSLPPMQLDKSGNFVNKQEPATGCNKGCPLAIDNDGVVVVVYHKINSSQESISSKNSDRQYLVIVPPHKKPTQKLLSENGDWVKSIKSLAPGRFQLSLDNGHYGGDASEIALQDIANGHISKKRIIASGKIKIYSLSISPTHSVLVIMKKKKSYGIGATFRTDWLKGQLSIFSNDKTKNYSLPPMTLASQAIIAMGLPLGGGSVQLSTQTNKRVYVIARSRSHSLLYLNRKTENVVILEKSLP